MATKLNKDVTRESTIINNERNIMVTLTGEQEISLKLKGMKSGGIKIKIKDLYAQLNGDDVSEPGAKPESVVIKQHKKKDESVMINLHDFRSQYLIDNELSYNIKVKLEQIITKLLKNNKK